MGVRTLHVNGLGLLLVLLLGQGVEIFACMYYLLHLAVDGVLCSHQERHRV